MQKNFNWFDVQMAGDNYTADYLDMIRQLQALTPQPKIYIMVPPPLYPPSE